MVILTLTLHGSNNLIYIVFFAFKSEAYDHSQNDTYNTYYNSDHTKYRIRHSTLNS